MQQQDFSAKLIIFSKNTSTLLSEKSLTKKVEGMKDKRPPGLNGHLSIRDFTLNSCQKGAYFHINSPIIIPYNCFFLRVQIFVICLQNWYM